MRPILFALLLMISIPAFADRSQLLDDADDCTFSALKQTQYSIKASSTPDDKQASFQAFIEAEVNQNPESERLVRFLGAVAWADKKMNPITVGYAAYHICLQQRGTAT